LPELPAESELPEKYRSAHFLIRNFVIDRLQRRLGTFVSEAAPNTAAKEAAAAEDGCDAPRRSQLVKQSKGPRMTLADEFYQGPSLRVRTRSGRAYHLRFIYQGTNCPRQLCQGNRAQIPFYSALERDRQATAQSRGSAGLLGRHRLRLIPFSRRMNLNRSAYPVKLGYKTFKSVAADIIYTNQSRLSAPNTMTFFCKLMGRDKRYLQE